MPNSRFALHGLAPPQFTVCAPFLPLIHDFCALFRPLLTPLSTAPSPLASQFTVCTSRFARQELRASLFADLTFLSSLHCLSEVCLSVLGNFLAWPPLQSLEGPTRKPRHASVFSTHSDTQAVLAFHCIRICKGIF